MGINATLSMLAVVETPAFTQRHYQRLFNDAHANSAHAS